MGCIGFSKKVISWFESYLSGRTFKINIDKKFSDSRNLTCGVPQESILGPLLFLLYVNDMPQPVKCDLFLYNMTMWRKMRINWIWISLASMIGLSRTNSAFIWTKTRLSPFFLELNLAEWAEPLNIVYGNIKIKQYTKVNYLGCILDESLSGESMALRVLNKINSRLRQATSETDMQCDDPALFLTMLVLHDTLV